MDQKHLRTSEKVGNLKKKKKQQTHQIILTPICDHLGRCSIKTDAKVRFKWRGQIKDTFEMFHFKAPKYFRYCYFTILFQ